MTKSIINYLIKKFPLSLQEEWDNCGVLENKIFPNSNPSILVCLDVNQEIVDYAIANKISLVIAHHPFLKDENNQYLFEHEKQWKKIFHQHKITILFLHTCCDNNQKGLNYFLLTKLKIKQIKPFDKKQWPNFLVGKFDQKITITQLTNLIQKEWKTKIIQTNFSHLKNIQTIGICCGSGFSVLANYFAQIHSKIDLLITGDIKYHQWLWANQCHIPFMDVGHQMEIFFTQMIKNMLIDHFPQWKIICWEQCFWPHLLK